MANRSIYGPPGPTPGAGNPLFSGFSMDRMLGNPLLHMGLGLLSQGPSLTPINPMAGLGTGLNSYMTHRALQDRLAKQDAELELKREEAAAKRAERERMAQGRTRAAEIYGTPGQEMAGPLRPGEARGMVGGSGLLGGEYSPMQAGAMLATTPGFETTGASMLKSAIATPESPTSFREFELARQGGFEGTYQDFLTSVKRRQGDTVNVNVPTGAQTDLGKAMMDLQYWQEQPKSPQRTQAINALNAKVAKASQPTAEVAERALKYKTAGDAMDRFLELAGENEQYLGPIQGRVTSAEAGLGTANAAQSELASLEATMITRLGTALSGAAIPEQEWPRYFAQIPGLSDSPDARAGKAKAFRETLDFLEAEAARVRGEQGVPLPESETVPRAQIDPSRMSTEDLLNMLSP